MKKLLLASVFAIASFPGYAHAAEEDLPSCHEQGFAANSPEFKRCMGQQSEYDLDEEWCKNNPKHPECRQAPPARVTVAPPYQGPPPIGWVYGPYTQCGDPPRCSMGVVNVQADGLNVRVTPNGPPVMALVNGTPLIPVGRQGPWLLVAVGCDLTPTFAWSWTANVPLNRCWVYF
jgi:hypothetical protein